MDDSDEDTDKEEVIHDSASPLAMPRDLVQATH
jgi:hypothetical protein